MPVFWCCRCQTPTATTTCGACGRQTRLLNERGRLRPVFAEELELVEQWTGRPLVEPAADLALWRNGRDYYFEGQRVASVTGGGWASTPSLRVRDQELWRTLHAEGRRRKPATLRRTLAESVERLRAANRRALARLEADAVVFLRQQRQAHPDRRVVVSWSGGKDSAVVSLLAREALCDAQVLHVFGDTTIEAPSTYAYFAEFRERHPAVPFAVGLPARDFFDLCREIGPPSRVQRWCCSTHKTAPLSNIMRAVGDGRGVLSVTGLRRDESLRRASYAPVIADSKIAAQLMVNPILDWTEFEVWAHLLASGEPINDGYRLGMNRIGCAYCPMNSAWWDAIFGTKWHAEQTRWERVLLDFAEACNVPSPATYVSGGGWKRRVGGQGFSSNSQSSRDVFYDVGESDCLTDDRVVSFELGKRFTVDRLAQILRPFGDVKIVKHDGMVARAEVSGLRGQFSVQASPQRRHLRVTFRTPASRRLHGTIRAQLRKLQSCVGCGACASRCPVGAITEVGDSYRVADSCEQCLRCVRNLKAGCVAADSVHGRVAK